MPPAFQGKTQPQKSQVDQSLQKDPWQGALVRQDSGDGAGPNGASEIQQGSICQDCPGHQEDSKNQRAKGLCPLEKSNADDQGNQLKGSNE